MEDNGEEKLAACDEDDAEMNGDDYWKFYQFFGFINTRQSFIILKQQTILL